MIDCHHNPKLDLLLVLKEQNCKMKNDSKMTNSLYQ